MREHTDHLNLADQAKKLAQMSYLPKWYLKNVVGGAHKPLVTVLFLTDYCNLRCKHCAEEGHAGTTMKSWKQIKEELQYAYGEGARFVDLEGGEPTLWREGEKGINDVIDLAKEIGFFSVTVTTNGQRPFDDLKADSIWVSVDGYRSYHDEVRGEGAFAKLNKHIKSAGHDALSINMAVNRLNYRSVADVIRFGQAHPGIKSVSINFHTPYPGPEDLMLDTATKNRVIDLVIAMKKHGYSIMNSVSGLNRMRDPHFKKYCWISNFILTDGTRLTECPGKTLGICDHCGFSMAGEMYSVVHFKPDTLLAGINLRV